MNSMRKFNQSQDFSTISFLAILAVVFFLPFSKGGIETSIAIGLISFFIFKYQKREFGFSKIPLALPFLFYIVAVELSMLQSTEFRTTAKGLLRVLKYAGLYWLVVETICDEIRFKWVIRVMTLTAFLSCLNGCYQLTSGWDFRHQYSIVNDYGVLRIRGSFNHPNNFAAYLTASFLVFLFSLKDTKFWQILKWVTAAFALLILFETKSRTPIIFLFFVLSFARIFCKDYRRYVTLLLLALSVVCGLYFFLNPEYSERFSKIIFGDGRMRYWRYSVDIALAKPWLGYGVKSFSDTFGKYSLSSIYGDSRFVYAHNFILQMWVEIGLVGVSAFLYLLGIFFQKAFISLKKSSLFVKKSIFGLILATIFFLMHSMVDNNLQSLQLNSLLWLYVGLVMSVFVQRPLE